MSNSKIVSGPSGDLELIYSVPGDTEPSAVAIICHPHPLHAGTMHNKVVTTLHKAFQLCGTATLRFNYRGVGASVGVFDDAVGECDDLRAVIDEAQRRHPGMPVWLGGFSFGAYIAARVANDDQIAEQLITIAPAIDHYSFAGLNAIHCPWLVVHGDQDDVASFKRVEEFCADPPSPLTFNPMSGADHFFHRRLVELREMIVTFLKGY